MQFILEVTNFADDFRKHLLHRAVALTGGVLKLESDPVGGGGT